MKSARVAIDKKILIANGDPTRWSKFLPKKVNIMVWKMMDRISTRVNLDARGIDIPSVLCPICEGCSEMVNHIFFECSFVTQVYNKFARWWDIHIPGLSSYVQWLEWFVSVQLPKVHKHLLEAAFMSLWWHVWCFRNSYIFGRLRSNESLFFDNLVTTSFVLVNSRCRSLRLSWVGWMQNPSLFSSVM